MEVEGELVAGGVPLPAPREIRLRRERAVVPHESHQQHIALDLARQRVNRDQRVGRLEVRAGGVDDGVIGPRRAGTRRAGKDKRATR